MEKAHIKSRFVTYRELTLEFLSSLVHIPERGFGTRKGFIAFGLFGIEFAYTHKELSNLLGFPCGPFAFSTTQAELMDFELTTFGGLKPGTTTLSQIAWIIMKYTTPLSAISTRF